MKLLFIYRYDDGYSFDHWLHEGFMRAVANYPGVESYMYGPKLHTNRDNKVLIQYNHRLSMAQIEEIFKPDVIICNTKSRMFDYYSPPTRANLARGCILPSGFKESKIPKIILEEDYHYELNDDWYAEMGFSMVLQRHAAQAIRGVKSRMFWLPFSVDTNVFKPDQGSRINKICFAGSMTGPYPDRIHATGAIKNYNSNMIDVFSNREKIGNNYVECLKRYVSHLNGASSVDITAAKIFEIMASGSVLFTNHFTGLKELFSDDLYVEWNANNVVEKAQYVLNNTEEMKVISDKALACIKENHTHQKRTEQLLQIIKEKI